jgi:hypothetical protein
MIETTHSPKDMLHVINGAFLPPQFQVPTGPTLNEIATPISTWMGYPAYIPASIFFNFTNYPEYRPLESPTMKRLPSEQRFTHFTTDLAKQLGSTGLAKNMELSPIMIDHIFQTQLGSFKKYVKYSDE